MSNFMLPFLFLTHSTYMLLATHFSRKSLYPYFIPRSVRSSFPISAPSPAPRPPPSRVPAPSRVPPPRRVLVPVPNPELSP